MTETIDPDPVRRGLAEQIRELPKVTAWRIAEAVEEWRGDADTLYVQWSNVEALLTKLADGQAPAVPPSPHETIIETYFRRLEKLAMRFTLDYRDTSGEFAKRKLTEHHDANVRALLAELLAEASGVPASSQKENAMNFGEAIQAMKEGKCVQRAGWNGKNMHIYLEDGYTMPIGDGVFKGQWRVYEPVICMFNAQGKHQPGWLASQPDILANDWKVVPDPPGATDTPK